MNFSEAYKVLNQNQKSAVDQIDGTVMVVAGPGTGKTQVLGARVASILHNTDTNPENILCLTFTEAATIALRKRLYQFIGSTSYKVNVTTYHGFSNSVIQENRDYFGIQDLDPIDELETLELVKQIIDELPNDSLIKRFTGDAYYDTKPLIKLFGLLKKDNLSSAQVKQRITKKLGDMKTDEKYLYKRKYKMFQKGDLNLNKYNADKEPLLKLDEAADLLDIYNTKLKERKRYDFNDMLRWVLNAFENNKDLLLRYQEQYHYFLVDEYQDTNGIQNDLLYQLISYWDNPNVFVVGDDDQSIYKFQGANVENIHQFYNKYDKHVELVVLDKNYRSSQQILNGSTAVIDKNNERLVGTVKGLSKDLIAANPSVADLQESLAVIEYPNLYQEIVNITAKLKSLKSELGSLNEVGILYRNHSQSDDLIKFLEAEGISYNIARSQNVLEEPIVHQLNSFLTYLSLETQRLDNGQHLLFEILHYHNFKTVSAYDIAKLSKLIYNERGKGWREVLNEKLFEVDLSLEAKKELKAFVSDIEYWLKEVHNITLQTLIERIMSKMGFVARALASKDAIYQIQCLKTYYNYLKEETARKPLMNLSDFLQKIELLQDGGIGLRLNKIVHGMDGVNLMTVHGSKGLEFDYVFLMGCTENKWEKDKTSLPYKLNLLLPGEADSASEEESRRLFYVALTRARKRIEVSYASSNEKGKDLIKSLYVVELEESGAADIIQEEAPKDDMLTFFDFMLKKSNETYIDLIEQDFVKKEVENFRLSATNLNSYLRCPVAFFYQNILRVPSAKSESATFGTAMHTALDGLFKNLDNFATDDAAKSYLVTRFKSAINNSKEAFTEESLKRRIFYGTEILTKYYDTYKESWETNGEIKTELYLKNCEIDGVPIRGQIDKVVINRGVAHVSDFKTGQYKYGGKKVHPPKILMDNPLEHNFEKRYGGDYWRQILFYKALIESDQSQNLRVLSGDIDFLEPDKDEFKKIKIMVRDEEYAFVRNQIKTVFSSIQNLEFKEGCEEEDCQWCNFNKSYHAHKEYQTMNLLSSDMEGEL